MSITELEEWFNSVELPQALIMLHSSATINDVRQFLDSHFYPLKLKPNKKNQPTADGKANRI